MKRARRMLAGVLAFCMIVSMVGGLGTTDAYAAQAGGGPTENIIDRVADPNTMDEYQNALLSSANGSRYAGRVWTDKTVVNAAVGASGGSITLDMDTDGYASTVGFSSDFAHVFSALTSSQVVNEFPPTPVDLVIVFDMSGSMGQDTRSELARGINAYVEQPGYLVPMAERIANSRVQKTLDAINETIDKLMSQNQQNRVAVLGYGANATVLMPLAHYRHKGDTNTPYLSVGGMETLYHPSDLVYKEAGTDGVTENGWYWMNNRDTCYTVVVNAGNEYNTYTGPLDDTEAEGNSWQTMSSHTVSNNVRNDGVKAFPGVEEQDDTWKSSPSANGDKSSEVYNGAKNNQSEYAHRGAKLIAAMSDTQELKADDYVGYFTNTQGGIYLAYKQLADTEATTYTDKLSTGKEITVARIPAAIIMSDGGANFAFNEMGTYEQWLSRFAQPNNRETPATDVNWYINDNNWAGIEDAYYADNPHRLPAVGSEWYDVYLPGTSVFGSSWKGLPSIYNYGADYYKDGTLSSSPAWHHPGILYSSDNDLAGTSGTVMEVLLTAAYMSRVVKEHYEGGWSTGGATKESYAGLTLSTYTMNVDTQHVPQWGRWRLYPTLDPKEYPLDQLDGDAQTGWLSDVKKFGAAYGGSDWGTGQAYISAGVFKKLKDNWEKWTSGTRATPGIAEMGSQPINIDPIPKGGIIYHAGGGDDVQITQADVVGNIAYNDEFYDVESDKLSDTFQTILSAVLGQVFVPVSGSNSAGVGDALTYQDPIGDYMEIKNSAITATPHHTGENDSEVGGTETTYDMALLHFGEMHGMVRTGVYDFQWNDQYMKTHPDEGRQGEDAFPMGWYKGDAATAMKADEGSNGLPSVCSSTEDAWAQGWVYRLNFKTLQMYVPIAGEVGKPDDLPEQEKNTVYTVYRFACSTEDRNALRLNPVYGTELPKELQEEWSKYEESGEYPQDNTPYANIPGVYRLSDIRVWTEEYGDFYDDEGSLTPGDKNFDSSLYMNIPSAALPTQLATISLGKDGVMSYVTNTENKAQSTPIRLFYAVGLDDEFILRDSSGRQEAVDIATLSEEYVSSHTNEDGSIWFISNYYSGSRYGGYDTGESETGYTRGDPTVTFSPGATNRYYVFQKPLPLYAHAYRVGEGNALAPVDNQPGAPWPEDQSGNGKTIWENDSTGGATWGGGLFAGVYESEDSFKTAQVKSYPGHNGTENLWTITDDKGNVIILPQGVSDLKDCVVFLESDVLDSVTTDETTGKYAAGSKSFSSDDYFFLLVEYYLPTDYAGYTIDAKGEESPLGSGAVAVQRVIARKGSEFGSGLDSLHINNGDMLCWTDLSGKFEDQPYQSYSETGDPTRGNPKSNIDHPEFKDGNWVVAAKTGGLRTGDLFQNRQRKIKNNTATANNYYVPTIATDSGVGDKTIINNYLGNNGRLNVANDSLAVTKLLTVPENVRLSDEQANKEFNYQVYIAGVTGPRTAAVLAYNSITGQWQPKIDNIDVLTDNAGLLTYKTEGDNAASGLVLILNPEAGNNTMLVAETDTDRNTTYYKVNNDGTRGEQFVVNDTSALYYVYLPPNTDPDAAGDPRSRRVWHNGAKLTNSGRDFITEGGELGAQVYWVGNAELISADEVNAVDGRWTHSEPGKLMDKLQIMTAMPTDVAGKLEFVSPFSTRTTYQTKELIFGQNANTNDNADGSGADGDVGVTLTADNLYDPIIPTSDRPAFNALTNDQIAANTAEFTLKSGEGLQFTGLKSYLNYRFTEKLTQADMDAGYALEEVSHSQQYGSLNTYMPGANSFTDLGAIDPAASPEGEPFYHTNAKLWESYATYRGESEDAHLSVNGNHHELEGNTTEGVQPNPACGSCDVKQSDNSVRHYFAKEGALVDKHYTGEQTAFGGNRYVVGATAHFLVKSETQESASTELPAAASEDYAGVYSVFGNTGSYEEQAHYVNTIAPVDLTIRKELDPEQEHSEEERQKDFPFTASFSFTNGGPNDEQGEWLFPVSRYHADGTPYSTAADMGTDPTEKQTVYGYMLVKKDDGSEADGSFVYTARFVAPGEDGEKPTPPYTYLDSRDGSYFYLKAGEWLEIHDLPWATGYTFTVAEALNTGYVPEWDVTFPVTITGSESAGVAKNTTVTCTNTVSGLTVTKTVEGPDAETERLFNFNLTLTPPEGAAWPESSLLSCTYSDPSGEQRTGTVQLTKQGDGTYTGTFQLQHDQSITFNGLPNGTRYVVEEAEAPGYAVTPESRKYEGVIGAEAPLDEESPDGDENTADGDSTDPGPEAGATEDGLEAGPGALPGPEVDPGTQEAPSMVSELGEDMAIVSDGGEAAAITGAAEDDDILRFVNTRSLKSVKLSLNAQKELQISEEDRARGKSFHFAFTLIPAADNPDGDPLEARRQKVVELSDSDSYAAKTAVFDELEFKRAGTYHYILKEEVSGESGILYDDAVYDILVEVTVADDNAHLTATVTVTRAGAGIPESPFSASVVEGQDSWSVTVPASSMPFKNTYQHGVVSAALNARKVFVNGELHGGEFSFTLSPISGVVDVPMPSASPTPAAEEPPADETPGTDEQITPEGDPEVEPTDEPMDDLMDESTDGPAEDDAEPEPVPVISEETADPEAETGDAYQVQYASLLSVGNMRVLYARASLQNLIMPLAEDPGDYQLGVGDESDEPAGDGEPMVQPEAEPTSAPTDTPDAEATAAPSPVPTAEAAVTPSAMPTTEPTAAPTDGPTATPTMEPSADPAEDPTSTIEPDMTSAPEPTSDPMTEPTPEPTPEPTDEPQGQMVLPNPEDVPMPIRAVVSPFGISTLTVENDANGEVHFGSIVFTQPGTYTYQIRENADGSLNYDHAVYYAQVVVTEDEAGELSAAVKYYTDPECTQLLSDGGIVFTNVLTKLEISKTVEPAVGSEEDSPEFTFQIDLTMPEGFVSTMPDGQVTYRYTGAGGKEDGTLTFTLAYDEGAGRYTATGSVTLKDGQSIVIEDLPLGTTYTVTETETHGYTSSGTGTEGTITDTPGKAEFINQKPSGGDLKVTKVVTGTEGETDRDFAFTVTLDQTLTGQYGEMNFVNGVASFTLRHGQSKTATGLPPGTIYTVSESDNDGYNVTWSNNPGTVGDGAMVEAVCTNNKGTETPPPEDTPEPSATPVPSESPEPSTTPEPTPTPSGPPVTSPPFYTPTPTPPGMPHKIETDPGDGKAVTVGQIITYRIEWTNHRAETATVTIRDPLDAGVDFLSADTGGAYDAASHTVTWNLGEQPAGASGYVMLQVVVNEKAKVQGVVKNQAFVKVNGDPEQETEIPENPLPPNIPRTGDENRPGLWMTIGTLCLAALGYIRTSYRRRREKSG